MTQWIYDMVYGLKNLWRFRREVWAWRGWDWEYSHGLYVRALEEMADSISTSRNHEEWERDVTEIRNTVALYRCYEDAPTCEDEEAFWERHWIALSDVRAWWD